MSNRSVKTDLEKIRSCLRDNLVSERNLIGFNLFALQALSRETELEVVFGGSSYPESQESLKRKLVIAS